MKKKWKKMMALTVYSESHLEKFVRAKEARKKVSYWPALSSPLLCSTVQHST